MANVKQGSLTSPPCWWKHMKFFKRVWNKQERQAYKKEIKNQE